MWGQRKRSGTVFIMDNVFLRAEHFFGRERESRLPTAVTRYLHNLPLERRFGINLGYRRGKTGQRYVVREPRSLFLCDPTKHNATDVC